MRQKDDNHNLERYMVFKLSGEDYALPLVKVKEVVGLTETTPMPYAPSHFLGILNLRGQVISIMDLRKKLKLDNIENNSETTIIILDLPPLSIGIVVDTVESVSSFDPSEIEPSPSFKKDSKMNFTSGIAKKEDDLVVLIDIEKALDIEDLTAIKNSKTAA